MKKFVSYIVSHLRIFFLLSLLAATVALTLIMFPDEYTREQYNSSVGSFWKDDDLYAPYDFAVLKSEKESNAETDRIKSESTLYFTPDNNAASVAQSRLAMQKLTSAQKAVAKKVLQKAYSSSGYCSLTESTGRHLIVVLDGNIGHEVSAASIITAGDIADMVEQEMGDSANAAQLTRLLVDSIMAPSIVLDENRTHLELDSRLSQISYSSRMVQRDELIVSKGQRIDEETAQVITSLEKEEASRKNAEYNPVLHYFGLALLSVIAFVALYIFLKNIRHPMLDDMRKVSFAFFIVIFISAIVALVVRTDSSLVLLVPVCIVPILMRVFFDMRVALYIHIVTVIIIGNMVPNSYEFIFYQLISGMMSIISVRNFEKRSNFFAVSLVIFTTYSLIYVAGVLSTETSFSSIDPERFLVFFLNAILTLLAYPLIYLFERMFGMVTNLTLLEISSTNSPALRELSQKAPGTFQHSIQVANLAEDIIAEIGGNALLAKVGALYHDIGKLSAPLYFTENQNNGFNPHDNLDYDESARIITQHVRDGISLAKKFHLPPVVSDFIRTHHGTTVTGYFYAQAKQHYPEDEINIADFRYLGPTPFSRETAVVMLADSVEAACKSLKTHDKESISNMVDRVIDDKIAHNQLNNCPLTLEDITNIRTRLKDMIMSIYHVRISYPVKP